MKGKIFLFLILLANFCFSQQFIPVQHDTTYYSHEIILTGMAEVSSSALKNEFTNKLIYGGFISDQIKNQTFDKHKNVNRLGLDIMTELEYRNMKVNAFRNDKIGFLVKGGYSILGSAIYTKDAFGLVFYGNSSYLGETADLTGSQFSFISFQKVGFGIINKKTKSNISLNLYNISDFTNGFLRNGSVTTNQDGTSIEVKLDGALNSAIGNSFSKGIGLGVDCDYRIPFIGTNTKRVTVQFLAKNIGVANYHSGIQQYRIDSSYVYDGLKFKEIYGDKSLFRDDFSLLDSLNIEKVVQKKTLFLPGFLQVGKIVDDNNLSKWQSFFGIRLYPSLTFSPLLFIGAHYKANKWLEVGAQATFGGFSNFRIGAYSSIRLKNWAIGIASQDVYGMISKKGFGQSLLFRVRCKI